MLRPMTTAEIIPFGKKKSAVAEKAPAPPSSDSWDSVTDMLLAVTEEIREGKRTAPTEAIVLLITPSEEGIDKFNVLRYGLGPLELIGRCHQILQRITNDP